MASAIELNQPPSDGITNIEFSSDDTLLVSSSWDCGVRVYDVVNNCIRDQHDHVSPALDCTWINTNEVVSGSLDKILKRKDITTNHIEDITAHDDAVKCVEYSKTTNSVITGSWDKTVKVWDFRATDKCQSTVDLQSKVYSMSIFNHKFAVATSNRFINIYDIRNMSEPEEQRESPLKYQTRCIRFSTDGTGFAISSTEGRCAMEYLGGASGNKGFVFKCHRTNREQPGQQPAKVEIVHPVNVIEFNRKYGTFATGGGDGKVNIWDGENKKRICQLQKFPTSISSLSFSNSGDKLAIAVSYTFEEGEKDHEPDTIWIRDVSTKEVQPIPRK